MELRDSKNIYSDLRKRPLTLHCIKEHSKHMAKQYAVQICIVCRALLDAPRCPLHFACFLKYICDFKMVVITHKNQNQNPDSDSDSFLKLKINNDGRWHILQP